MVPEDEKTQKAKGVFPATFPRVVRLAVSVPHPRASPRTAGRQSSSWRADAKAKHVAKGHFRTSCARGARRKRAENSIEETKGEIGAMKATTNIGAFYSTMIFPKSLKSWNSESEQREAKGGSVRGNPFDLDGFWRDDPFLLKTGTLWRNERCDVGRN